MAKAQATSHKAQGSGCLLLTMPASVVRPAMSLRQRLQLHFYSAAVELLRPQADFPKPKHDIIRQSERDYAGMI